MIEYLAIVGVLFVALLILTSLAFQDEPRSQRPRVIEERSDEYREYLDRQSEILNWHKHGYQTYLQSPEWFQKRDYVKARDNFTCQHCESRESLEVHHLSYINVYFEEDNDYADLITLCRSCHQSEHDKENE